jgi:predicted GNAT family acetyltransferase
MFTYPGVEGHIRDMDFSRNEAKSRFELAVDGDTAFLEYRLDGKKLVLTHAEVPEAFEGLGYGSKLVKLTLQYARDEGLSIEPDCSFVRTYFERHPEEQDVLAA